MKAPPYLALCYFCSRGVKWYLTEKVEFCANDTLEYYEAIVSSVWTVAASTASRNSLLNTGLQDKMDTSQFQIKFHRSLFLRNHLTKLPRVTEFQNFVMDIGLLKKIHKILAKILKFVLGSHWFLFKTTSVCI